MKTTRSRGSWYLYIITFVFLLVTVWVNNGPAQTTEDLTDKVASLKLGLNGYIIGWEINDEQKKIAAKNPVAGSYKGTYKFSDNGLNVVVDQKSNKVLALYKNKKNGTRKQLKEMVAELMDHFDAPTTIAHDKILYWAFNKYGPITEEDFNKAKKIKATTELGIIATVKLNSEIIISPDQKDSKTNTDNATGTVYYIITSDPMVANFINSHQ